MIFFLFSFFFFLLKPAYLLQNIFVTNEKTCSGLCDGSFSNPYPGLFSAFSQISANISDFSIIIHLFSSWSARIFPTILSKKLKSKFQHDKNQAFWLFKWYKYPMFQPRRNFIQDPKYLNNSLHHHDFPE